MPIPFLFLRRNKFNHQYWRGVQGIFGSNGNLDKALAYVVEIEMRNGNRTQV
jgi:hypothetical protein